MVCLKSNSLVHLGSILDHSLIPKEHFPKMFDFNLKRDKKTRGMKQISREIGFNVFEIWAARPLLDSPLKCMNLSWILVKLRVYAKCLRKFGVLSKIWLRQVRGLNWLLPAPEWLMRAGIIQTIIISSANNNRRAIAKNQEVSPAIVRKHVAFPLLIGHFSTLNAF